MLKEAVKEQNVNIDFIYYHKNLPNVKHSFYSSLLDRSTDNPDIRVSLRGVRPSVYLFRCRHVGAEYPGGRSLSPQQQLLDFLLLGLRAASVLSVSPVWSGNKDKTQSDKQY